MPKSRLSDLQPVIHQCTSPIWKNGGTVKEKFDGTSSTIIIWFHCRESIELQTRFLQQRPVGHRLANSQVGRQIGFLWIVPRVLVPFATVCQIRRLDLNKFDLDALDWCSGWIWGFALRFADSNHGSKYLSGYLICYRTNLLLVGKVKKYIICLI